MVCGCARDAEDLQQTCPVPLGAVTNPTLNEEDMVIWRPQEGNSVHQDPLKHVIDNITVDTNLLEPDSQNVKVCCVFLAAGLRDLSPNVEAVDALVCLWESEDARSWTLSQKKHSVSSKELRGNWIHSR